MLERPVALRLLITGMPALAALVLFAATAAPTVTFIDSGELIVAAWGAGIPHPPGFPLYTLLGHLWTLLPLAAPARELNLFSAVCASLACGMVALLTLEIVLSIRDRSKGDVKVPALVAMLAGLLAAGSRTLWAYATVTEVYALNSLLLVTIAWLLVLWRRTDEALHDRALLIAAFLFGLSLGVHHLTMALTLLAMTVIVVGTAGWSFFRSATFLQAFGCATAGLLVYLYLPFAASRQPALAWGQPDTPDRFWAHLTGRMYRDYVNADFSVVGSHLAELWHLVLSELSPAWLPAALLVAFIGYRDLLRRDPVLGRFLPALAVPLTLYALVYDIEHDLDAYYLPLFLSLIIATGIGAHSIAQRFRKRESVVVAVLFILPVAAIASNFPDRDRSGYDWARTYAEDAFRGIERGGLLLSGDDQLLGPILYLQNVEDVRTDAAHFDLDLAIRPWYLERFRRHHPDVVSPIATAYDTLHDLAVRFEREPAQFRRSGLGAGLDSALDHVVLGMIRTSIASRPVYTTWDIAMSTLPRDESLVAELRDNWQLVPQGIVLQVFREKRYRVPLDVVLHLPEEAAKRGLPDDPVVQNEVVPTYLYLLTMQGRQMAAQGRYEEARRAYERALELRPDFQPARDDLARLAAANR